MVGKLSHFRAPAQGAPMWSGRCIYDIPGVSPSVSEYDAPSPYVHATDGLEYRVHAGTVTEHHPVALAEPTLNRRARVSANFDSVPAARFFQGFGNVRWSGIFDRAGLAPRAPVSPRPLTQAYNPNAFGAKELHPATQYKPFPPMGSIVPAYGERKQL